MRFIGYKSIRTNVYINFDHMDNPILFDNAFENMSLSKYAISIYYVRPKTINTLANSQRALSMCGVIYDTTDITTTLNSECRSKIWMINRIKSSFTNKNSPQYFLKFIRENAGSFCKL